MLEIEDTSALLSPLHLVHWDTRAQRGCVTCPWFHSTLSLLTSSRKPLFIKGQPFCPMSDTFIASPKGIKCTDVKTVFTCKLKSCIPEGKKQPFHLHSCLRCLSCFSFSSVVANNSKFTGGWLSTSQGTNSPVSTKDIPSTHLPGNHSSGLQKEIVLVHIK